jgi:hypothetical protein
VHDVKPENKLTTYGITKLKDLIRKMKDDPSYSVIVGDSNPMENPLISMGIMSILSQDPECFNETGRYNISYVLPIPAEDDEYSTNDGFWIAENDIHNVEIRRVEKSEKKAISINKDDISPLSGKIISIVFENDGDLTIDIE